MPDSALSNRPRGSTAFFIAAMIALVTFTAAFWYTTSTRITAIEAQLAELGETHEHQMLEQNWRSELDRAANELEVRANTRLTDLEARLRALVTAPDSVITTGKDTKSAQDAVESGNIQPRPEPQLFDAALQSLYRSLALTAERRDELGTQLEALLDSIWPEYVELSRSSNPDTTALQQLYCDSAQSFLTAAEAGRLGC